MKTIQLLLLSTSVLVLAIALCCNAVWQLRRAARRRRPDSLQMTYATAPPPAGRVPGAAGPGCRGASGEDGGRRVPLLPDQLRPVER